MKKIRIALAGNPNSGKTTLYNALTGQNEKVGNWAGVTVDRKEHSVKKNLCLDCEEMVAVDLPGAYSMSPFTGEESITSEYVKNEKPDVIINIVDATNLSRSLFFTTQLLELGIPTVVALNKSDLNKKKKNFIDSALLSEKLGCPVVDTVGTSSQGLTKLAETVAERVGKSQTAPYIQGDVDMSDKKAVGEADRRRFAFVDTVVKAVETRKSFTKNRNFQDKIDALLTNRWLGLPIFALVMFLVFSISQAWLGPLIADGYEFENGTVIPGFVTLIDWFKEWVAGLLVGANPFLAALLTEGIIGGVSAVVGFLPLVMVMYFLIALLEDCGYMARATVVLDPVFKKVGLSGKSVIPFVIGTGCAIPGVMACRTIRDPRERRVTAMLSPFMPCGAKLPVIALFSGAFFSDASWIGTLMYFLGIFIILLFAVIVNKIAGYKKKSFFIIELPEYKFPSLGRAAMSMLGRGKEYLVKAATIILLCNALVFVMQSFDWSFVPIAEGMEKSSILGSVSQPIALLLVPIVGVAAWQMAAATVTGFIAKENVVGTLAVCYGISNLIDTEELSMAQGAGTEVAAVFGITRVAALAFLVLNLFSPPCFAAIGAMNAEIDDKKWFWGGIGLQIGVGYTLGFLVYQIGTLITEGKLGAGFFGGLCVVVLFCFVLAVLCIRGQRKINSKAKGVKV